MRLYTGLVASGGLVGLFGLFLVGIDLTIPLGTSLFGLPLLVVGAAMVIAGFISKERSEILPEPGRKFCWYCTKQIPVDAKECSFCGLRQVWD